MTADSIAQEGDKIILQETVWVFWGEGKREKKPTTNQTEENLTYPLFCYLTELLLIAHVSAR